MMSKVSYSAMRAAISAFVIHAWRLRRLDKALERELAAGGAPAAATPTTLPREA